MLLSWKAVGKNPIWQFKDQTGEKMAEYLFHKVYQGVIKWFNPVKGFGFIACEGMPDMHFLLGRFCLPELGDGKMILRVCYDGEPKVKEGTRVIFEINKTKKGLSAWWAYEDRATGLLRAHLEAQTIPQDVPARCWHTLPWAEVLKKYHLPCRCASKINPDLTLSDVIELHGENTDPCPAPGCGHPLNRHNNHGECDLCPCGWEDCTSCGHSEWDHVGGQCQNGNCHCGDQAYEVPPGMEDEPQVVNFTEGPMGHHGCE